MITYQEEKWDECCKDMEYLWPMHYDLISLNKGHAEMKVDVAKYKKLDDAGVLHIVTARKDGKVIGYYINFIDELIRYMGVVASNLDVFFVHPKHQKGWVGIRLFKEGEKFLKKRGVKQMFGAEKLHYKLEKGGVGKLFTHLGWKHIENHYSKWIGD